MTHMAALKTGAAALALAAMASTASASTAFYGEWAIGLLGDSDPGLVVQVNPTSGEGGFNLNVGESTTFDLFAIWTNESAVNPDDLNAQQISVDFTLTQPSSGNATATGSTVGALSGFLGFDQGGELTWNNPTPLNFGSGNTGELLIELSEVDFNWGNWWGTSPGKKYGAQVTATVTYAVAPIPLPAAGFLMLGALGGLGLVARRRKNAA
ncbi:MAG: VPLPA-CTERM sorting domain-containing protein [Gemmobacter sp.]